jgi:hypothetical protein
MSEQPPVGEDVPARLIVVAYVIALLCVLLPLAVIGAGFAGAVIFQRGRRVEGAGVIVVAIACVAIAVATRS